MKTVFVTICTLITLCIVVWWLVSPATMKDEATLVEPDSDKLTDSTTASASDSLLPAPGFVQTSVSHGGESAPSEVTAHSTGQLRTPDARDTPASPASSRLAPPRDDMPVKQYVEKKQSELKKTIDNYDTILRDGSGK